MLHVAFVLNFHKAVCRCAEIKPHTAGTINFSHLCMCISRISVWVVVYIHSISFHKCLFTILIVFYCAYGKYLYHLSLSVFTWRWFEIKTKYASKHTQQYKQSEKKCRKIGKIIKLVVIRQTSAQNWCLWKSYYF